MEHQKQWDFLKNKFEAGQLGHAYVFPGSDTDNLKSFANELVKLISGQSIARLDLASCQRSNLCN